MYFNSINLYLVCVFIYNTSGHKEIQVQVDCNQSFAQSLKHFWKSSGLCPPDPKTEVYKYLLSDDEKLNLAFIGALPNRAITHVRIHWLINLIFIRYEKNVLQYNFTHLDRLLDWLHDQKLYPGFELMGTPIITEKGGKLSLFKQPFSKGKDIYKFWYGLVTEIVHRYIEKYGFGYVKKWRFETWNEPDLVNYNILNFTLQDYLQYVRGSGAALDAISSQRGTLKLGGPAGLFKDPKEHPLCWGLLRSCNKGKRHACPIKFVSFHEKGDGTATQVLNKSVELLDVMYFKFPHVRRLPIANDEADILTDWSKSEEWRGDVRYAAMIAKVVIDYFKKLVRDRNEVIEVLSNDNGFLNYHPYYFTQRTLLARFQMNATNPPHMQFIKKPSYIVMGLLSLLGQEYLKEGVEGWDPLVDFLASTSRRNKHKSGTTSLLITYVNNTEGGTDKRTKGINAVFNNLPDFDSKYVIYVMDNLLTNPFLLWKDAGSPIFPPQSLREEMRRAGEPFRFRGPASVVNSTLEVQMNLTLPSVALIHVCSRSSEPPGRVTHLKAYNVTRNEVLLIWKDTRVRTKCIRTYEIEFAPGPRTKGGHFRRINKKDTIFLSYHHTEIGNSAEKATRGRYRVRAVDYWNTPGRYSKILKYPEC